MDNLPKPYPKSPIGQKRVTINLSLRDLERIRIALSGLQRRVNGWIEDESKENGNKQRLANLLAEQPELTRLRDDIRILIEESLGER